MQEIREISKRLLEETSGLLCELTPIVQRSIKALQDGPNPLLQDLIQLEIGRQETLLKQIEKLQEKVDNHRLLPEHKLLRNTKLRLRSYPSRGPLGVTMCDGEQICLNRGSETLVEVIKKIGIERVESLDIMSHSIPLVSTENYPGKQQTKVGDYYIAVNTSTTVKIALLEEIASQLGILLKADDLKHRLYKAVMPDILFG